MKVGGVHGRRSRNGVAGETARTGGSWPNLVKLLLAVIAADFESPYFCIKSGTQIARVTATVPLKYRKSLSKESS